MKKVFFILCFIVAAFAAENTSAQTHNGHAYVDLGLPSGTLWATCNVGANKPSDYGDHFAWGETETKTTFNWENYRYCKYIGDEGYMTKYCNDPEKGYLGFTDDLTHLQAIDDAATANWGKGWCTPTEEQWVELISSCEWYFEKDCYQGVGPNGKMIIFPTTGNNDALFNDGTEGRYWSASVRYDNPLISRFFNFSSRFGGMSGTQRFVGFSVRPVKVTKQEQQKPKSLVGTKWKWEEEWEWPEEWGENLYDSDYYTVYEYFEFVSENKLYHESDFGLLGGDGNYYYYTFDGNKGEIFFDKREEFILKKDEKGLYFTLKSEEKQKFRQVKE